MSNVVFSKLKNQPTDKVVRLKIFDFLEKLAEDDTSQGLRVKKMNQAVDHRARTARIDQNWRAVLYLLEDQRRERTWVFAGAWEHDVAIERAKTLKVTLNEINGAVELIATTASTEKTAPPAQAPVNRTSSARGFIEQFNYSLANLTDELGFEPSTAASLLGAKTEDEVLALAEGFQNVWEQNAALSLAAGESIGKIRIDLGLEAPVAKAAETDDERIIRALRSDASRMQFAFAEDTDELRTIIEDGDFAAWRVFLHPEQSRYATGSWNGPFRLSGGAGTGKTVVLLHRARHLAQANPAASIVLTTFTRALAENLKRDLALLDPDLPIADELGDPGLLIRGVDQLAAAVRARASRGFGDAAAAVFGLNPGQVRTITENGAGWKAAVQAANTGGLGGLGSEGFLSAEYINVVLPARVWSADEYFEIRRPGRRVALDRARRKSLWAVIEEYRDSARSAASLSYAEVAEVAAAWLDLEGERSNARVDHVLVDEGQDLSPSQWNMLRALARPGTNDLFIAEDTHQRIYGSHVVLAHCGIAIVGRSRRLTLNYRTTAENLSFAVRALEDAVFLDGEGDAADVQGYRSARHGPVPLGAGCASDAEQLEWVASAIEGWLSDGVEPASIAVLTHSKDRAGVVKETLTDRGVPAEQVQSAQSGGGDRVLTMTMHTAKGMEFSRVVLFDISDGTIPGAWTEHLSPEEREDALLRERSLLYVAASRARDTLAVTWRGRPSSLLHMGSATDEQGALSASS